MMADLFWTKTGDAYYLASSTEELVKLQFDGSSKIIFWMNNEVYEVRRLGWWSRSIAILHKHQEVLVATQRSCGSGGTVTFADGAQFLIDYKSSGPFVLRVMDGQSEILRYRASEDHGQKTAILTLGITLIDAERLLQLATLGMVLFLTRFKDCRTSGNDEDILLLVTAAMS